MSNSDEAVLIQFDWESAKRRIEETHLALNNVGNLSTDAAETLMRRRAEQLAKIPVATPDNNEVMQLVRFWLGDESFAVATEFALELTRPSSITPIPDSGDFLIGLVNLRGEVTSVWDLRRLLGVKGEAEEHPQVLVMGRQHPELAIVVDRLDQVMTIHLEKILEPMSGIGSARELICGCTSDGTIVLDGKALLNCEDLFLDQTD